MAPVGGGMRGKRGATTAFVAVSMVALASVMALAIDLGMLIKARTDAQRAADAAALAGASAFLDNPDPAVAAGPAEARARDYAGQNTVLGTAVDGVSETTVTVIPAERKVRVVVHREGIGTWFARLFGVNAADVSARAAAHASEATTTTDCVKPSAIRDMWNEVNTTTQDQDTDKVWDWGSTEPDQELWVYENATGDAYDQALYGYGSPYRNDRGQSNFDRKDFDYGRRAILMDVDPAHSTPNSFYQAWGFDSSDESASSMAERIRGCDGRGVTFGQELRALNGGQVGPITRAWDDLANDDSNLSWDDNTNAPIGTSKYGDWTESSRVIVVVLFSPVEVAQNNENNFHAANLAKFFLEKRPCGGGGGAGNCKVPVTGRFLGFVTGFGGGAPGSLVRKLQLIE